MRTPRGAARQVGRGSRESRHADTASGAAVTRARVPGSIHLLFVFFRHPGRGVHLRCRGGWGIESPRARESLQKTSDFVHLDRSHVMYVACEMLSPPRSGYPTCIHREVLQISNLHSSRSTTSKRNIQWLGGGSHAEEPRRSQTVGLVYIYNSFLPSWKIFHAFHLQPIPTDRVGSVWVGYSRFCPALLRYTCSD